MIELREGRLPEAEKKFSEMQFSGESTRNTWKKAHALAGQAIIASLQGGAEDSRKLLATVRGMNQKLDDVMEYALEERSRRNSGR